jgi:hypothetical protein
VSLIGDQGGKGHSLDRTEQDLFLITIIITIKITINLPVARNPLLIFCSVKAALKASLKAGRNSSLVI